MKRNKKRWLHSTLLGVMIFSTVPVAAAEETKEQANGKTTAEDFTAIPQFVDMRGHYAEEAVKRLSTYHYVSGKDISHFAPQEQIRRMDFAVLLAKAVGVIPAGKTETSFTDVPQDLSQAAYVNELGDLGVIKGKADQAMGATEFLTREDMAVLLNRMADHLSVASSKDQTNLTAVSSFTDEREISDYAVDAVRQVTALGWVSGSKNVFHPKQNVTRAEAAIVLDRIVAMRISQAEKVDFVVNKDKLALLAGTSEQITVKSKTGGELPFTPVFAFDNRDIGTIEPDGTFVAGVKPGRGQITVSVGYKNITIPVEVISSSIENKPDKSGADSKAGKETKAGSDTTVGTDSKAGTDANAGSEMKPSGDAKQMVPTDSTSLSVTNNQTTAVTRSSSDGQETKATLVPSTDDKQEEELSEDGLQNLAPKSHFTVKSLDPSDPTFVQMEKKYPGPAGGLVTPSELWTGYLRQMGREATVTLNETKSLQKVALTFQQNSKAGIYFPTQMEVDVSKDGKAWSYAGKVINPVSQADPTVMERTMFVTLPTVDAKYVRVRFPVKVFVFARQLQVLGYSELQPAKAPVLLAPTKKPGVYEDRKAGDKLKDVLLVFTGNSADAGPWKGDIGLWRKEDFLPHVAYISPDGIYRDRMFDAVQFMPFPNLEVSKKGWEGYIDDLFQPGRQLGALEEAMSEMNRKRGTVTLNRSVEKVILALPYPSPKQSDFGKVLDYQDSLSFDSAKVGEERSARYRAQAVQWYLDRVLKRWNEAGYNYLELEGIYWYHELVDEAAPQERDLILKTSAMVHNKGLHFYWIPYFGSPGIADWKDLGFDYAFLQPNFYFDKTIPVDRIEVALATANKYGMGLEVEGDPKMINDASFYQMYYNQLIAGHKLGIDKDKIHAYYFGSKGLLYAYNHKDPNIRAIYDDTYKWMRGQFTMTDYMDSLHLP